MKIGIGGVVLFLLVIGLVAGISLVNRNQDVRKKASQADVGMVIAVDKENPIIGSQIVATILLNSGVDDNLGGLTFKLPFDATKLRFDKAEMINPLIGLLNDGLPYDPNSSGCIASGGVCNSICVCAPGIVFGPGVLRVVGAVIGSGELSGNGIQVIKIYFTTIGLGTINLKTTEASVLMSLVNEWAVPDSAIVSVVVKPVPTLTPIPPTSTPTPVPPTLTPIPPTLTPTPIPPTLTPTPIPPTLTPTPPPVPGDASGDRIVDLIDFGIWRREYLSGVGIKSDFSGDGKVSLIDFGIWRKGYLNLL